MGWLERPPPRPTYLAALDLGQLADYSAWCVVERQGPPGGQAAYHVRDLHRWPLGTAYPAVVQDVVARLARPPLDATTKLVADATGCGLPVVDLLRPALGPRLAAVLITAGAEASRAGALWHVPKQMLVAGVQVALQTGRLKIAAALPAAAALQQELASFQMKFTPAANVVYGTWREGQHDDLVLSVALAVWAGEHVKSNLLVSL
jgi:hypothetical protein